MLPDSLREELKPVVAKGIKNIFSELFHVEIVSDDYVSKLSGRELVCLGRLYQSDMTLITRFLFNEDLLKPLLAQLYASEYIKSDDIYESAACEIVNILCNQIKAFLNKHGYNLEFDIPQMEKQEDKVSQADSVLNVHFSLNEDQHFIIDLEEKPRT